MKSTPKSKPSTFCTKTKINKFKRIKIHRVVPHPITNPFYLWHFIAKRDVLKGRHKDRQRRLATGLKPEMWCLKEKFVQQHCVYRMHQTTTFICGLEIKLRPIYKCDCWRKQAKVEQTRKLHSRICLHHSFGITDRTKGNSLNKILNHTLSKDTWRLTSKPSMIHLSCKYIMPVAPSFNAKRLSTSQRVSYH